MKSKSPSSLQSLRFANGMIKSHKPVCFLPTALSLVIRVLRAACKEITKLQQEKVRMDKKMAKITKEMKVAEKDVKKGKPKAAVKELKKAEKKNVKLTKIDREERDPFIKKAKKMLKKKGGK